MRALVGYTGFVGGNLSNYGSFDALYNSTNIKDAFGTKPDVLYFAGIGAEKFLANSAPEKDFAVIENAMRSIEKIQPGEVVLISTVDVYKEPRGVDEDTVIETDGLHPYGRNRYLLEKFVRDHFMEHLIVRLPGLFGDHLKKNFIYDMISRLPAMLDEKRMNFLNRELLSQHYLRQDNGFYKLRNVTGEERRILRKYFDETGFSALDFTDSRAKYQFYNLKYLYRQLELARQQSIRILNMATESCEAGEIYEYIFAESFSNNLGGIPVNYDMKTKYDAVFGGNGGYLCGKDTVMREIKAFVTEKMSALEWL